MDDYLKQQILDHINQAQNITLSVNKNADFDSLASGLALCLSLSKAGKNVSLIAKNPTVGDAQMLYGVDSIGKSEEKKNLIISIDNAVKNVDKVTYFLDGNKLKVVIHAFATTNGVQEKDIQFEKVSAKPDLIIAIEHTSINSLKTDITHEQQFDPDTIILSINKETSMEKFAQININEDLSIAEIVTDFIKNLALPLDEDIAFNLYAGLASATKMFSPNLIRSQTFETAQLLISFGAGKASFANISRGKKPLNIVESFDVDTNRPSQVNQSHQPDFQNEEEQTPIEQVEREKPNEQDWLKPPKIYRGSKSFDTES